MKEKTRTQDAGQSPGNSNDRERQKTGGESDPASGAPGTLVEDDRGNVTWQWTDEAGLNADDVVGRAARVRALVPKDLEVEDEDLAQLNKDPVPVRRSVPGGYDPYQSGNPNKQSWKKKKDLRELSKWIELKKRMKDGDK